MDEVGNPIDGVFCPADGVRHGMDGLGNLMDGVRNLIFGVPDPKLGVNHLKSASKWRGYGVGGFSGVTGEVVPLRLKNPLRAATFSAAPGAEAPALYWV